MLPFAIRGNVAATARTSDGAMIKDGRVADLFQHGFKPFGGESQRPQRLEKLLD
jgi:hypothetical protein